jgi:hypothetical protein
MSEGPRDWDKELAAIDKVIARSPASPPGAAQPATRPTGAVAGPPAPRPVSRGAALATWLRVILGLTLAAAMTQWPYAHDCGLNLFLYLGAAGVVVVAGLWSSISSWYRRLGWAHALSLLVVLWGGYLTLSEVLPRIGYAKHIAFWTCP